MSGYLTLDELLSEEDAQVSVAESTAIGSDLLPTRDELPADVQALMDRRDALAQQLDVLTGKAPDPDQDPAFALRYPVHKRTPRDKSPKRMPSLGTGTSTTQTNQAQATRRSPPLSTERDPTLARFHLLPKLSTDTPKPAPEGMRMDSPPRDDPHAQSRQAALKLESTGPREMQLDDGSRRPETQAMVLEVARALPTNAERPAGRSLMPAGRPLAAPGTPPPGDPRRDAVARRAKEREAVDHRERKQPGRIETAMSSDSSRVRHSKSMSTDRDSSGRLDRLREQRSRQRRAGRWS